ncbi:GNAT family N-acetyltransferase [Streptomyces qinzhouensis]|uniref:GNAT family N-acetyltransferase n=1 Tax=Streptomyces qinzhouensis TaxID=2599401 RepID=A0A5B8JQT0_9ACTN|nr:N-acetyltransferase [Streptomyces qinzhouensis]QDY80280.1 GNAT family N-acetyltransferase [Streptomyces qinzhouensis]
MTRVSVRTSAGLDVTIRPAAEDDYEALHAAFAALVLADEGYPHEPGPLLYEEFAHYWLENKSLVAVGCVGRQLAGSYHLTPNFLGRASHIGNGGYFVLPEWRGKGIGTALVTHSLGAARKLGFDAMQFNLVRETNPARQLYERLGFEIVGRIPDAVGGEAGIIYWRRLT